MCAADILGAGVITADEYFAGYPRHPGITLNMRASAHDMLARVNALLDWAETQGWQPQINPHTGTLVSGQTDGGWRPKECKTGFPNSAHKQARAVDVFDPGNSLDSLITDDVLEDFGLYREAPEATAGWTHLTDRPPGSKMRTFNP